jgi:hypothetical protein
MRVRGEMEAYWLGYGDFKQTIGAGKTLEEFRRGPELC